MILLNSKSRYKFQLMAPSHALEARESKLYSLFCLGHTSDRDCSSLDKQPRYVPQHRKNQKKRVFVAL